MKTLQKRYFFQGTIFVVFYLFVVSCEKPEEVLTAGPRQIILEVTVPSMIYSNTTEVFLDARRTINLNARRQLLFSWTCVLFPSAARAPKIESPDDAFTKVDSLMPGEYRFQLSVQDNIGNKSEANFVLEVRKDTLLGVIPKASAGPDQEVNAPRSFVALDGYESLILNPPYRQLHLHWTVIKQPPGSPVVNFDNPLKPVTNVYNLIEGNYMFQLEVKNEYAISAYDTTEVKVNPSPLKGVIKVYDELVWMKKDYDGWGESVILEVLDLGIFLYYTMNSLEVRVWDEDKHDWADPKKFDWIISDAGDLHIIYPWSEDYAEYTKEVGKKT
jgi:hypothetical protein